MRLLISSHRRIVRTLTGLGCCGISGILTPAVAHDRGLERATAFTNVSVIPMDRERVLSNQTVLVKDGRIAAIGPSATIKIPKDARRIDGHGKFLIPGLADMHVHLGQFDDTTEALTSLLELVGSGVTLVRNMDPRPWGKQWTWDFVLRLRARTASGALIGPRIYTAGPWWIADSTSHDELSVDTTNPNYVLDRIRRYKAAGFDFVKIHDETNATEYHQVVAAAKQLGIPFEGHVTSGVTLQDVLDAHQLSIEHLQGYPTETVESPDSIAALVAATKAAGTWNCPTLMFFGTWANANVRKVSYGLVKAMQDGGVGLLSGTDWGGLFWRDTSYKGWVKNQAVVLLELQKLVDAGLTPYQALTTSTRNPALFFGTIKETGTVEVGKRADLVLLNANPLDNIANVRQVAGVVLNGRWFTHDDLLARLTAAQQHLEELGLHRDKSGRWTRKASHPSKLRQ